MKNSPSNQPIAFKPHIRDVMDIINPMVNEIQNIIDTKNASYSEIRTIQDKIMREANEKYEKRMKPVNEIDGLTEN